MQLESSIHHVRFDVVVVVGGDVVDVDVVGSGLVLVSEVLDVDVVGSGLVVLVLVSEVLDDDVVG